MLRGAGPNDAYWLEEVWCTWLLTGSDGVRPQVTGSDPKENFDDGKGKNHIGLRLPGRLADSGGIACGDLRGGFHLSRTL